MISKPVSASGWRKEFAAELSREYAQENQVRMIVLGGSPSRGLADAYSDLDMIVYWDEMNLPFIEGSPLKHLGGELQLFMNMKEFDSMMELYYFDTLIVEVGHITLNAWEKIAHDVLNAHEINPMLQKTLGGFLDSFPLYGEELVSQWKERIAGYPDEVGIKTISRNLGFFWHGCILNQGLKRGDVLFFYDALCMSMKRLLAILAGLNKRYFSPIEPRWIEYELSCMTIKPKNMWVRMKSLFEVDREIAIEILEELITEVMELVEQHAPGVDLTRARENDKLQVRACYSKPVLKKNL